MRSPSWDGGSKSPPSRVSSSTAGRPSGGACCYSLFWGTNRRKEEREVKAPSCTLNDITAVKAALTRFAVGETVVWLDTANPDDARCATPEMMEAIEAHCSSLGIVLWPPNGPNSQAPTRCPISIRPARTTHGGRGASLDHIAFSDGRVVDTLEQIGRMGNSAGK